MLQIRPTIIYSPESTIRRVNLEAPGCEGLRKAGLRHAVLEDLQRPTEKGRPHSVAHILVLFLIRGRFRVHLDERVVEMSDGQMLAVPPRPARWLSLISESARWMGFQLHPSERWNGLLDETTAPRPSSQAHRIEATMEQLLEEDVAQRATAEQARGHLSELLLLYLTRETRDTEPTPTRRNRRSLTDLWAKVNGRLEHPWSVAELASQAHLSPPHLHKLCRTLFRATPMQMVARLRMEQAKTLLIESNDTIDQVAGRVGYTSPYSFSDAFLKHSGMRPGAYRKRASSGRAQPAQRLT